MHLVHPPAVIRRSGSAAEPPEAAASDAELLAKWARGETDSREMRTTGSPARSLSQQRRLFPPRRVARVVVLPLGRPRDRWHAPEGSSLFGMDYSFSRNERCDEGGKTSRQAGAPARGCRPACPGDGSTFRSCHQRPRRRLPNACQHRDDAAGRRKSGWFEGGCRRDTPDASGTEAGAGLPLRSESSSITLVFGAVPSPRATRSRARRPPA